MKYFLPLLLICIGANLNAQSTSYPTTAEGIINLLRLDQDQSVKLQKIIDRKEAQIEEITPLKSADLEKYISKRSAINDGMVKSIQLLINKNQVQSFNEYLIAIRTYKAELMRSKRSAGANQQEIRLSIAEMPM